MLSNGIHIGRRGGVRLTGGGGEGWPSALRSSLVAFWPLSESSDGSGAVSRADLAGANTLTDNNTVASTTGLVYPLSANFVAAGSNVEHLSINSNAAVQTGDIDFWIAAWFAFTTNVFTSFPRIVSKNNATSGNREYNLGISNGNLEWQLFKATDSSVAPAVTAVTLNDTHFVLAYHNAAANSMGYSLDGAAFVTTTYAGSLQPAGTAPLNIGRRANGDQPANGRIGPVMLGKGHVPSAADVTWLYNSGAGRAY
jgi:hypothetical protein